MRFFLPPDEQLRRIKSAVSPLEIISEEELLERLRRSYLRGEPLIVKQGFDASAPDLHLGHAISLWKLRSFQDLGHKVIFLIGDFTGMVGDPSGRSRTRPRLSRNEVLRNAQTYRDQVFRILDPDPEKLEIRFNSEWHSSRTIEEFLELCSRWTVRRMLERDDFWQRFQAEEPISILEFLYPLIQAYDSVALKADIELGGGDQRFNLMLTRHIQRSFGQEPEVIILMPLLRGTDGAEKMSKSLGNAIGITDSPQEMYGKLMSIPDLLLEEYLLLTSGWEEEEVKRQMREKEPYELKHTLAYQVVSRFYGEEQAEKAQRSFLDLFRDHRLPTVQELKSQGLVVEMPQGKVWLPKLMVDVKVVPSTSEALRLIRSGAVEWDGVKVKAVPVAEVEVTGEHIVKVGKRRFFAVVVKT
ncbi:MAG: tyrosine--tRNA ligase [bacterium]